MLIVTDEQSTFRDCFTSSFLATHKDNAALLESIESAVDATCLAMNDCMRSCADEEQTETAVIRYLKEFEERQNKIDENRRLQNSAIIDATLNNMAGKLVTLFSSVDKSISSSIEKMDLDSLRASIVNTIRECSINTGENMTSLQHKTFQMASIIESKANEIKSKLDTMDTRLTFKTNKQKGKEGETGIFDLMSKRFRSKNGYSIEDVSSIPRNCDIVLHRDGFPSIRFEIKNYTDNVDTQEVVKFRTDLEELNEHGIFISLQKGIANKGDVDMEILPNNKIAVYLSHNNYNIDVIDDWVNILYDFDRYITGLVKENDPDNVQIAQETLAQIKTVLNENQDKIDTVRNHLRDLQTTLSKINLPLILSIILNPQTIRSKKAISDMIPCSDCGQLCPGYSGLNYHKKETCPGKDSTVPKKMRKMTTSAKKISKEVASSSAPVSEIDGTTS
jgi:hypothetical protein